MKNIIPYAYHNLTVNYRKDDKDDWNVMREIFVDNIYRFHSGMLEDDAVVIDVGANIGAFTLQVLSEAKNAGKKVHVYAIEPEEHNLELLYKNLEANHELTENGSTVEVLEIGIYSQNGIANINNNSGSSRLTNDPGDQEIELWSYDKLVQYIDRDIDMVKADIEGSEIDMINGASAESILKSHYYAIEFDEHNVEDDFVSLIKPFLSDFSFNVFGVPGNGCNIYLENHSWKTNKE